MNEHLFYNDASISRKKPIFFPESCGLLNLLKKKRPGRVPDNPEIKASNDGDHNKSGKYYA